MSSLKPIALLTSKYLRKVGLPQAIPIGTGSAHFCRCKTGRPTNPEKVRLGFIPDDWFEFFYPKTGVTGPYFFGLGLLNFLFSKEIYVCEHEFYSGLSLCILCVVGIKKFGPKVAAYLDKECDKIEKHWKESQKAEIQSVQNLIDAEELEQWRAEGSLMLMRVKKENITLQVEAAYREALMNVYEDVMKRLKYQEACYNVANRISHKNMVTWLVKNVTEQLPKNIDQTLLQKYRKDVSAMALRVK